MTQKNYDNILIERLENSEVEISGEIPADVFSGYINDALSSAKENAEVPGFRKGNAPESVVEEHIGEDKILNEAAQNALSEVYPQIIEEEKIDAIGRPSVSITKLAKENPLQFKIKTAVTPEVELPDYKVLAKEVVEKESSEEVEPTEEEINQVVNQIRQNIAEQRSGEQSGGENQESEQEATKQELPELTDEFVQSLGNFQNVDEFKNQIRENIKSEKQTREREKTRLKIMEKIIDNTNLEVPPVLIESELDKMMSQVKDEAEESTGYTFDDYLNQIQKSEEDLRQEWRGEAEKRAKVQVMLNKMAANEGVSASEHELEENLNAVMERYPDADRQAASTYVETVITNDKVYKMLESQGEKQEEQTNEKGTEEEVGQKEQEDSQQEGGEE